MEVKECAPVEFLDSVLRGIGQVMLQSNAYAGALLLAGVIYNSVLFGIAVVVGTAVSTATAVLLGAERSRVRAGLFGFNGALVAVALLYFLRPGPLAWGYVVVASAFSSVLTAAVSHAASKWDAPGLTAPFIFTALCFVLACARFGRLETTSLLPTAGLPKAATVEGVVGLTTVAEGVFKGLSEVFFQDNVVTGVFFVVALLVSSRVACFAAVLGSFIGLLVGWLLGAAEPALRFGLYGFNSALTTIALGGTFLAIDRASMLYAALGATVAAVVFAAASAALEPIGMPALTTPFVLVVWFFLLARPLFTRLRPATA
ncbi:MAG: urea transporter [Polyangiaceae bacterium]